MKPKNFFAFSHIDFRLFVDVQRSQTRKCHLKHEDIVHETNQYSNYVKSGI
jgi:hypothetical protein